MNQPPISLSQASCQDDYDPNSMSVEAARTLIHRFLKPVEGYEQVSIRQGLNRILAKEIISPLDVPAHVNSAMDGYAVRHADLDAKTPASLHVIGSSFAGHPYSAAVSAGECVRIMTGGVMPKGTDTVVIQEKVRLEGSHITVGTAPKKGDNVREKGEDLRQGQVVLASGHMIRPADLGLLASLGINEIRVFRRLRVAFFSTGDELRSIGTPLEEGQIYDSNRYTLYGMLKRLDVDILDMGVVEDAPKALEEALIEASTCADVILTSGGVSVGEADFIRDLLQKLGEVVFWKIAMKPGRPLAYGKIGPAHFFGLPGNPVSVMVTFYQFVQQAIKVLMGQTNLAAPPTFRLPCLSPLKKAPGRTEFQRGILVQDDQGNWAVQATGAQGSGILRSMSDANCFIILPEAQGHVAAGDMVEIQLLEGIV
ncbi:MAG: molybdopterin molybdotransferase MoeA [Proteobacteria bacterium]|nr:molybdopterin molybdotransferase MoeA [Pseudomonadota bacterium]